MQVALTANPQHPAGFYINFPFSWDNVNKLKLCLGAQWNKPHSTWESFGPEILLDFQRFDIQVASISPEARVVAENFRQQIITSMDNRLSPVPDEKWGFQTYGSNFLASMPNSILADEMGTGKSKQSLDAAVMTGAKKILILGTKTITFNWLAEVNTWHPEIFAGVLPPAGKLKKAFWEEQPDLVIANYEKLFQPDWPYQQEWDVVICDEATKLKNYKTQTHNQVKRIVNRSEFSWFLTGTPLEKKLAEYYNLMNLLRPAVLGNFTRFREQHLITDDEGNVTGTNNLELLRERIGPFMLRRTKKEVMPWMPEKLPPIIHHVQLSEPEKAAYHSFNKGTGNWLTQHNITGGDDDNILTIRRRQFCATPAIWTDDLGRGSKFEALLEILDEWDDKVVIFCFFKEVTKLLRQWLNVHPRAYIDGDVNDPRERLERVQAFNAGELGNIFVSTDAGQVGLNITGANLIIHYDQIFNAQNMKQREDRLHRIGQEREVNVIHLLCDSTIDMGIYQVNLKEAALFEDVVDGSEMAILRKLNAHRLQALIEGRYE